MTVKDFRKIALSLPETEERVHMNHPDFRVAGKIFATLGYPDKTRLQPIITTIADIPKDANAPGENAELPASSLKLQRKTP